MGDEEEREKERRRGGGGDSVRAGADESGTRKGVRVCVCMYVRVCVRLRV